MGLEPFLDGLIQRIGVPCSLWAAVPRAEIWDLLMSASLEPELLKPQGRLGNVSTTLFKRNMINIHLCNIIHMTENKEMLNEFSLHKVWVTVPKGYIAEAVALK